MVDDDFYDAVVENEPIEIDIAGREIVIGGTKTFKFNLPEMEWKLTVNDGITAAYKKHGNAIWERLVAGENKGPSEKKEKIDIDPGDRRLAW